jgi:hypothetical protein
MNSTAGIIIQAGSICQLNGDITDDWPLCVIPFLPANGGLNPSFCDGGPFTGEI